MKLKSILFQGILAFQFCYLNINYSNTKIESYFDLAEIEDVDDPDSLKITKKQIENIKKAYYNKINKNIDERPLSIFTDSLRKISPHIDYYSWWNLITHTKNEIRTLLLKKNCNLEDINNHRIIDIFIISTLFIESDISTNKNIDQNTKDFLKNIYDNISNQQKNILIESIRKSHKKIFNAYFCFNYPNQKKNQR